MSRGEHWVTAVFRRSEPNPKKTSVFEHFVLPNNKCCNRGMSDFRDAALAYTSTMLASRIIRMRCGMSMQKKPNNKVCDRLPAQWGVPRVWHSLALRSNNLHTMLDLCNLQHSYLWTDCQGPTRADICICVICLCAFVHGSNGIVSSTEFSHEP